MMIYIVKIKETMLPNINTKHARLIFQKLKVKLAKKTVVNGVGSMWHSIPLVPPIPPLRSPPSISVVHSKCVNIIVYEGDKDPKIHWLIYEKI